MTNFKFRPTILALLFTVLLPTVSTAQVIGGPIVVKKLKYEKSKHAGHLSLYIDLEYPASGPEAMVQVLTDTMLTSICLARSFNNDTIYLYEYATNWQDLPTVLWNSLNADWKDYATEELTTSEYGNFYSLDVIGECIANTSRYATFELYTNINPFAAHGMPAVELYTADAATGKLVSADDIFLDSQSEELETLLFRELYAQHDGYRESVDAMEMSIDDWLSSAEPLPSWRTVALVPEGVRVQYQAYEIAVYVAGAPTCILPLHKIRHLLTPYALRLLGESE